MYCAVIGGGAWGTALADHLARRQHQVTLWAREEDVAREINTERRNSRFLAGAALDARLRATSDLREAAAAAKDFLLLVTPSQVLRGIVHQIRDVVHPGAPVVVASKGIEKGTLLLMHQVVEQELREPLTVALSGPSFSAEVVAAQPTAVVAASRDEDSAAAVQRCFSSRRFRVYTQSDVVGVELGGSLKNVMAIATGISDGLGLGHNSRAALITRGLAEITRLGLALGARSETFAGLAGVGDLVLTCTGSLSRNRSLGMEIGAGLSLAEALRGKETIAEGVATTESALELAQRLGVDMPIVDAVYRTLFRGMPAAEAIGHLMERELRSETD
jgi:glycerol-3-phosphate dehydrogenase (NAD(P)+)